MAEAHLTGTHHAGKIIRTGGCQCGHVRYEITAAPRALYVCHCRECQKQSASAFGISVIVDSADLRLIKGELRRWSRPSDSGNVVECFFCALCGSRLWHGDKERDATVSVKGGSLDQPPDLGNAVHIWTRRKLPGVPIPPDAAQFPGEPEE
ncbi:MAG TPA: GFA family protein [Dongiaceae bacterium]|nr:GFA family protein [Dongiaceae bacterium]